MVKSLICALLTILLGGGSPKVDNSTERLCECDSVKGEGSKMWIPSVNGSTPKLSLSSSVFNSYQASLSFLSAVRPDFLGSNYLARMRPAISLEAKD